MIVLPALIGGRDTIVVVPVELVRRLAEHMQPVAHRHDRAIASEQRQLQSAVHMNRSGHRLPMRHQLGVRTHIVPVALGQVDIHLLRPRCGHGRAHQLAADHLDVAKPTGGFIFVVIVKRGEHRLTVEPRAVRQRIVIRLERIAQFDVGEVAPDIPDAVRRRLLAVAEVLGVGPHRHLRQRRIGEPLRVEFIHELVMIARIKAHRAAVEAADVRAVIVHARPHHVLLLRHLRGERAEVPAGIARPHRPAKRLESHPTRP